MKKVIYLTLAFLMLYPSLIFCITPKNDEKSEIDLTISNPLPGKGEVERSINTNYVNAFLLNNTKEVEVELFNIGDAYITIINHLGQAVVSDYTSTNIPTMLNFNINSGCGTYCIIISSPKTFAQGWFVLQ